MRTGGDRLSGARRTAFIAGYSWLFMLRPFISLFPQQLFYP
jgi:hypothetical protein